MRRCCLFLIDLAQCACSETASESLDQARGALAESRYVDAAEAADLGLARNADAVTAWGLELVKLEALAREGRGDDTVVQLEKLAGTKPKQVAASQYAATADQLRPAGQGGATLPVLDLGRNRFPEGAILLGPVAPPKAPPSLGGLEPVRIASAVSV